jgi:hypothetical protein
MNRRGLMCSNTSIRPDKFRLRSNSSLGIPAKGYAQKSCRGGALVRKRLEIRYPLRHLHRKSRPKLSRSSGASYFHHAAGRVPGRRFACSTRISLRSSYQSPRRLSSSWSSINLENSYQQPDTSPRRTPKAFNLSKVDPRRAGADRLAQFSNCSAI